MESKPSPAPLDEMSQRLAALHTATSDLRRDVNEIKLRLFNGLTDTMRETYAKVLILENKQQSHEDFMNKCQKEWASERALRGSRDRAVLLLVWFSALVNLAAAVFSYTVSGGFGGLF
jgi:type III secretory pathway component EscR